MNKYVNGKLVSLSETDIAQKNADLEYWNNNKPSAFDMAIENLRAKRNKLLADSDYTVLQDSTYTDAQVAEWVIYRQSLRDITNGLTTVEDVNAVVFPTKPE